VIRLRQKEGDCMKEIMKSKIMVGFMVFVLGITYLDSMNARRLEQTSQAEEKNLVVMNANLDR
jgi:hypothetical protein